MTHGQWMAQARQIFAKEMFCQKEVLGSKMFSYKLKKPVINSNTDHKCLELWSINK